MLMNVMKNDLCPDLYLVKQTMAGKILYFGISRQLIATSRTPEWYHACTHNTTKHKQMNSTIPVLLISQHVMLGQLAVYNSSIHQQKFMCVYFFGVKNLIYFFMLFLKNNGILETYGSMWC